MIPQHSLDTTGTEIELPVTRTNTITLKTHSKALAFVGINKPKGGVLELLDPRDPVDDSKSIWRRVRWGNSIAVEDQGALVFKFLGAQTTFDTA